MNLVLSHSGGDLEDGLVAFRVWYGEMRLRQELEGQIIWGQAVG